MRIDTRGDDCPPVIAQDIRRSSVGVPVAWVPSGPFHCLGVDSSSAEAVKSRGQVRCCLGGIGYTLRVDDEKVLISRLARRAGDGPFEGRRRDGLRIRTRRIGRRGHLRARTNLRYRRGTDQTQDGPTTGE